MTVESLAQELDFELEGGNGHVKMSRLYTVELPSDDKNMVLCIEMDSLTGAPTGKKEVLPRKKFSWQVV